MSAQGRPARLGLAALVLAGAVVTGIAAVAVHDTVWGWPLAVGAVLGIVVALPPVGWARPVFCGAWSATVFALSVPRPDGDYLVSGDAAGYGLLLVAALLVVMGVAALARGRSRVNTETAPPSP